MQLFGASFVSDWFLCMPEQTDKLCFNVLYKTMALNTVHVLQKKRRFILTEYGLISLDCPFTDIILTEYCPFADIIVLIFKTNLLCNRVRLEFRHGHFQTLSCVELLCTHLTIFFFFFFLICWNISGRSRGYSSLVLVGTCRHEI